MKKTLCAGIFTALALQPLAAANKHNYTSFGTLPAKGQKLLQLKAIHASFDQVFDENGKREGVAGELANLELDGSIFPFVGGSTLGQMQLGLDFESQGAELLFAYGLNDRLSIGAIVPFSKDCSRVSLALSGGTAGPSPLFDPSQEISAANAPFLPTSLGLNAPASVSDIQNIITQPAFGLEYQPIQSGCNSGLGDPTFGLVGAAFQDDTKSLLITAAVRPGWGSQQDDPDDLFDFATYDGSDDVFIELDYYHFLSKQIEFHGSINHTWQFSDHVRSRVPTDANLLALKSSTENLKRKLGNYWELEAELGYYIKEWFLSAGLYYYKKAKDQYTSASGQNTFFLEENTEVTDKEWSMGVRWDGIPAWSNNAIPIPFILELKYWRSFEGKNSPDLKYTEFSVYLPF